MHAIITGVCGQDGAYLAKHLLDKGYKVTGWARRNASTAGLEKLGVLDCITLKAVDICDPHHVAEELHLTQPTELYNLAAQSHVGMSFDNPMLTCQVNYGGYLNILMACRKYSQETSIYQACTSEMFGYASEGMVTEATPFAPMSPYAISKVAAYWAGVNARFEANQFVVNGILFNHESPLRGKDFVTRKITEFVKNYKPGMVLSLGNLDSVRDWGHARDYVEAMHLMMQYNLPMDFIVATGQATTVRTFVRKAFEIAGLDIIFDGQGAAEVGYCNGMKAVEVSPQYYRPNDLKYLKGSAAKAERLLGWKPKTTLDDMIKEMLA